MGRDYGPGGKTMLLTNAPVEKPWPVFDDDDDRSLSKNCCIKEVKQLWDLGYPPQKTERPVRVHAVLTLLMFALATPYCLACAREATSGESVDWQQWRRQLLEPTWEIEAYLEKNLCHRDGQRFQVDAIAQVFDPAHEAIHRSVPAMFVEIVGTPFVIRCLAHQPMEGTDHHGMGYSHNRPFLPMAGCQALIEGGQVCPFGTGRGMDQLGEDRSQYLISQTGPP